MGERFASDFYDDRAREMAEGLVEANSAFSRRKDRAKIARRKAVSAEPATAAPRAAALAGGGSLAALAGGARAEAPAGAIEFEVPDDPTKVQGRLTGDDGGYGSRAQFETEVR